MVRLRREGRRRSQYHKRKVGDTASVDACQSLQIGKVMLDRRVTRSPKENTPRVAMTRTNRLPKTIGDNFYTVHFNRNQRRRAMHLKARSTLMSYKRSRFVPSPDSSLSYRHQSVLPLFLRCIHHLRDLSYAVRLHGLVIIFPSNVPLKKLNKTSSTRLTASTTANPHQ